MLNFKLKGRTTTLQAGKINGAGGLPAGSSLRSPIRDEPEQTNGVHGGVSEANVDQLLVERVQKGDKRAFDLLIQKYQHRIVSLVSRYVSDPAEAQDVAQEAFIKAYRAVKRFRGESAFYTWLYRIAINTAKNWIVARNRRPPSSDIDAGEAEQYAISDRLRENSTPESELLREEIEETVFETIANLPEDLRTAIILREMDGMSYEEIAVTMECPIGTVRSRIFRAREAIDEKLKPLIGGHTNSGE